MGFDKKMETRFCTKNANNHCQNDAKSDKKRPAFGMSSVGAGLLLLKVDLVFYCIEIKEPLCSLLDALLHSCDLFLAELFKLSGLECALVHIVHCKSEVDVKGDELALTLADYNVRFSAKKSLNCKYTEFRCKNAVNESGVAASYNVSKACKLGFNSGFSLNLLRKCGSIFAANALGDDDYEVSLADLACGFYLLADRVIIVREFGNNNGGSAGCDSGVKRDIAGTASHNLNNVTSRVRFAGVAKLVDKVDNSVHSRIKADGRIGG